MRNARLRRATVVVLTSWVVVLASCDDRPTGPSRPPAPTISHIALSVPPQMAPGDTVQFTASAHKTDGSVENVTSQAQWLVTNTQLQDPSASQVLMVDSTGLASARDRGEVLVTVGFGGRQASSSVLVLPAGTFRHSVRLMDGPLGLSGVVVEVIEGIGAGLSAVTDESGTFQLFGLSGLVRWRAKKNGYLELTRREPVNSHSRSPGLLQMTPSDPQHDHTGTYTLTITTQAQCGSTSGSFPDDARTRTYTAHVRHDDAYLSVQLSGAEFVVHNGSGDAFGGQISSSGEAVFWMGFYNGDYSIAERLGTVSVLFDGMARARGDKDKISGTMEGYAYIGSPAYPFARSTTRCPTDRFEMVRR